MNLCPFCGSASFGTGRHQCFVGMGSFKAPGLPGAEEGSKKAEESEKKIREAIAKAGAASAAATKAAARMKLSAQKVHERGEMQRTRTSTLLKWGVIAGGALLVGLVAFGAIAAARKRKGRS